MEEKKWVPESKYSKTQPSAVQKKSSKGFIIILIIVAIIILYFVRYYR